MYYITARGGGIQNIVGEKSMYSYIIILLRGVGKQAEGQGTETVLF